MRKTSDELVADARATLHRRASPEEAVAAQAEGALLVDIRGDDQIRADGAIPGALRIPRNVLEWRCDPESDWRHPEVQNLERFTILICNEGFQSSLAAANLQQLGFTRVTDLAGGFAAWREAGLPVEEVSPAGHWDEIYIRGDPSEVTWLQPEPTVSLMLIDSLDLEPDAAIVDVGGGGSCLARRLRRKGFKDITVVDVSSVALAHAGGDDVDGEVHLLKQDLLRWAPERRYDVWHDRALFHFFVWTEDRRRYLDVLKSALNHGGIVIVATFAEDAPSQCSGLPTVRYSSAELVSLFGDQFALVAERREVHRTPAGTLQPFTWVVLQHKT
jgi:rhodanese-related sulfurtransferase